MSNLTALIARVQAILLDSGTVFSTATVTAAARRALQQFNRSAPIMAGNLVAVIADRYEYELTADLFPGLLDVLDVLEEDPNAEADKSVTFSWYFEDGRPFIRLAAPASGGIENLIVRYTQGHTINGLDSEVETTLNAEQETIFCDGAAAASILIRLLSRTETINLAPDIIKNYQEAMGHYEEAFAAGLVRHSRRPLPRSEPDTRAWNDSYHDWEQ